MGCNLGQQIGVLSPETKLKVKHRVNTGVEQSQGKALGWQSESSQDFWSSERRICKCIHGPDDKRDRNENHRFPKHLKWRLLHKQTYGQQWAKGAEI